MQFLIAIYDENNEMYSSYGLTTQQCRQIVTEVMSANKMQWEPEIVEESKECEWTLSPSSIVSRLISWGWLKSDFDEKINDYIVSFPEYSQLYVELFRKINEDENERERESMLAVYSALYTYFKDEEKNNDILINALNTSRRLSQLMSNMQDGMREYFDEMSRRKDFLGIVQVLVSEINNSDSAKYAILTTTDSFYRYKEAIKELVGQIISDADNKEIELKKNISTVSNYLNLVDDSLVDEHDIQIEKRKLLRNEKILEYTKQAQALCYRIEREFSIIEKKYNKLIDRKTVFAKRALARIHYILQEGNSQEDNTLKLINVLNKGERTEEILSKLQDRLFFSSQFHNITNESMYRKKGVNTVEFKPVFEKEEESKNMLDYIPKPLYTKQELKEFREKNTKNGRFVVTKESVTSTKDLEKLMFLWNEVINEDSEVQIQFCGEIEMDNGMKFSKIMI